VLCNICICIKHGFRPWCVWIKTVLKNTLLKFGQAENTPAFGVFWNTPVFYTLWDIHFTHMLIKHTYRCISTFKTHQKVLNFGQKFRVYIPCYLELNDVSCRAILIQIPLTRHPLHWPHYDNCIHNHMHRLHTPNKACDSWHTSYSLETCTYHSNLRLWEREQFHCFRL
jgi:hypothetical protein